jgi:hypothetical protein
MYRLIARGVVFPSILLIATPATAQISAIQNADVQSYFAGNSESLPSSQQSDPVPLAPWGGTAGFGTYPLSGPANVPVIAPQPLFPATLGPANGFAPAGWSSTFSDPPTGTVSQSNIIANPPGGANVADGNAQIDFLLNNPTTTYAYHQVSFSLDYLATGPLGGGIAGAPTFLVTGTTTGPGSYAQVAGVANYFWTDINSAGVVGPSTPLGSLEYNWSQIGPGSFANVPVNPLSSSNLLSTPPGATNGVLSIVGEFFVAGDPAVISVTAVPEPTGWTAAACGAMALLMLGRSRPRLAGRNSFLGRHRIR